MAWTEMDDLSAGDLITKAIWDQVKGDAEYILDQRVLATAWQNSGSDYTVTGITWTNVDATNMKLTMVPAGSRVLLMAAFLGGADNVDGSALIVRWKEATAGVSDYRAQVPQNTTRWVCIADGYYDFLIPETTYTFYLQFRNVAAGGTATIYRNGWPVTLIGLEV